MKLNKMLLLVGIFVAAIALSACAGPAGPQGPEGPAGSAGPAGPAGSAPSATDLTCTACHNDTGTIAAKREGWEASAHGDGTAYAEEYGNKSCVFCHAGRSFSAAIAAGTNFSNQEAAATEPSRQDCYTCHKIHTTYTADDWARTTTSAVSLVTSKATFDGGEGNLCANCHQARRYMANFADKTDPTKYATTGRFNTHYSVQADTLMGLVDVGAALGVEGKPAAHYSMVEDTCVGCHMGGETANHTFAPQVATCVKCHADAESFDVNGFRTAFEEKVKTLEAALLAKGLIEEGAEGMAAVAGNTLDAKTAGALFTYFLVEEDGSMGVHNPNYFTALVDAAIAALK